MCESADFKMIVNIELSRDDVYACFVSEACESNSCNLVADAFKCTYMHVVISSRIFRLIFFS